MRKLNLSLLSLLALVMFSCDEAGDLLDIEFEFTESRTFNVPIITAVPADNVWPLEPVTVNTADDFQKHNVKPDLIKEATLTKIVFTIPDDVNENFGFMKDVEVTISSANNPTEVVLAHLHNIPANQGKTMELLSSNTALAKYVKDSTFTLRALVKVDETTTVEIPVKMDITFQVTANPVE